MTDHDDDAIVHGRMLVTASVWDEDPAWFEDMCRRAPSVSVSVNRDADREKASQRTDAWGCTWRYPGRYLAGQVVEHPLDDWSKLDAWVAPSPDDHCDWAAYARDAAAARAAGGHPSAGAEHGFLYLRLTYLRGFENFMMDVAEGRPELERLRDLVADYWLAVVRRQLAHGARIMKCGDDLGHQDALPISPQDWRRLLKPAFRRIFDACHDAGARVYLHTDGWILDIIPDLIEIGVDVLNAQDLVNGVDNLARLARGRVDIDLDIDRQAITAFGTPAEIDAHIGHCVRTLGSPRGGLDLIFGAYPGTPRQNIAQVALSMEAYRDHWVGPS